MNDTAPRRRDAAPSVAIIVVAAGRGSRLGADIPKQYLPIAGTCSLRRVIDKFRAVPAVEWLLPVVHPEDDAYLAAALGGLDDPRVLAPVAGGQTRARSVRRGLEALVPNGPDLVLVHDAARPFVSSRIIAEVIEALAESDGACAALPVVDALWRAENGRAVSPVPRDGLWRAQTPQGFRFQPLLDAHRRHDGSGADDVAVAREAGLSVSLTLGSERNYKITTRADLARAEADAQAPGPPHAEAP